VAALASVADRLCKRLHGAIGATYLTAGSKLSFAAPQSGDTTFEEYISDPAKPVPFRARTIDTASWSRWLVDDQREASGVRMLRFLSPMS
jgi:predicted acyl esterase